jgi:hypothetical protein
MTKYNLRLVLIGAALAVVAPGVAGGVCTVTCKGLGYLWIMWPFNEVTGAALTVKGSLYATHEDPLKLDLLKYHNM